MGGQEPTERKAFCSQARPGRRRRRTRDSCHDRSPFGRTLSIARPCCCSGRRNKFQQPSRLPILTNRRRGVVATLQKTFVHLDRSVGDILHFQGAVVFGPGSKRSIFPQVLLNKLAGREAEAPEKLPIKLPIYRMRGEVGGRGGGGVGLGSPSLSRVLEGRKEERVKWETAFGGFL